MSVQSPFKGFSFHQKDQLDGLKVRVAHAEEDQHKKVISTVYDTKIIDLNLKDGSHFTSIANLDVNKVTLSNYNDKITELNSADTQRESKLLDLTNDFLQKVSTEEFDGKLVKLNAIAENHDLRLDELEKRSAQVHTSLYETAIEELKKKTDNDIFQAFKQTMENIDIDIGGKITELLSDQIDIDQIQNNQESLISNLLDQSVYTDKKAELISRNQDIEKRLLAIDQFFRILEPNYKIYSPSDRDKQIIYTASYQTTIPTSAMFEPYHRRGTKKIGILLTSFCYNTFTGLISVEKNNGVQIGTLTKSAFPAVGDKLADITFSPSITSLDYPIKIKLLNTSDEILEMQELEYDDFMLLTNISAVTINYTTKSFAYIFGDNITINEPTVTGPVGSFTVTGSLPGLTLQSNGSISGIINAEVDTSYTIRVVSQDGPEDYDEDTIHITSTRPDPINISLAVPETSYKFVKDIAITPIQITKVESDNISTYSMTSVPGLSISTTGEITGTVNTAGTYPITVSGTTSDGRTGSVQFTITIDINRKFIPTWGKYLDGNNSASIDGTGGIAVDSSNNVYVVGHIGAESSTLYGSTASKPANGADDGIYLIKYNSSGVRQWIRWLDGAGTDRAFNVSCGSGIVYVAGNGGSGTTGNFPNIGFQTIYGTKTSTTDGFIVAFSDANSPQWMRWLAGSGTDNALSIYTRMDNSTEVYVCGSAGATTTTLGSDLVSMGSKASATGTTGYLIKLGSDGSFVWGKWIDASGDDACEDIIVDASNNVYVAGYATGGNTSNTNTIFGANSKPSNDMDSFIIKYNTNGTRQWAKWMGEYLNDKYTDMCISNNIIYLTGYTTRNGLRRTLVDKIDTNGNVINYNCIGESAPGEHYGNGITVDADGYIYLCGVSQSGNNIGSNSQYFPNSASTGVKGFLIKLDNEIESNNNMLVLGGTWLGTTGSAVTSRFLTIDSNKNLLLAGNATSSLAPFNSEIISAIGNKPHTSQGGFIIKFGQGLI